MNAIADTGFVLAVLSKADRHNSWAELIVPRLKLPVLTCEAVIAETAFHMRSAVPVLEMIVDGTLAIAFDAQTEMEHLLELEERFADQRPDFADLCLIRMSEMYPHHRVITVDENDFRVYRRNKRDVIPLLCPPRRQ